MTFQRSTIIRKMIKQLHYKSKGFIIHYSAIREWDQSETLFLLGTLVGTPCWSGLYKGFMLDFLASIFEHILINRIFKISQRLDLYLEKLNLKKRSFKNSPPRNGVILWSHSLRHEASERRENSTTDWVITNPVRCPQL